MLTRPISPSLHSRFITQLQAIKSIAVRLRVSRAWMRQWKFAVMRVSCIIIPHSYTLERIMDIAANGRPAPRFVGKIKSVRNARTGLRIEYGE